MKSTQTYLVVASGVALSIVCAAAVLMAPGDVNLGLTIAWLGLTLFVAWAYIGIGLVTMERRPSNVVGTIIIAVGFAAFIYGFQATRIPALFIFGVISSHMIPVLIGNLLMVYPDGRFGSRFQRLIVALAYFEATALAVLAIIFLDTSIHCANCARNPLLVAPDEGLQQAITVGRFTIDCIVTIGLAVVLSRRWYAAVPTQRAALSPVLWSGGATLVAFFVSFVSDLAGAPHDVSQASNLAALAVSVSVPCAVAFGFARSRFTRAGAISDLVATLTSQHQLNADLRDALARSLEDPSLELAYWLPHQHCYVDADGQIVEPPGSQSGRRWHSVELNGEMIAAIVYDQSIGDQSELIRAAGGAAALTLENNRLEAELRANVIELRRSRARLLKATDAERKRIERDLHDGAQQQLLSIALKLNLAAMQLREDPAGAADSFVAAASELTRVTGELRDLARGIHPAILTDRGLAGALEALADRSPVRIELSSVPKTRLPELIESTAYFVVAESMANVIRHAEATHVVVSIFEIEDIVVIEISDDGIGGANPDLGTGLSGLADRLEALDGNLVVQSEVGGGTQVHAELPRGVVGASRDSANSGADFSTQLNNELTE